MTALGRGEVDGDGAAARLEAAVALLNDPGRESLDIISGPTFLARLYRIGTDDHVLCLYVHHAMCDGWSIGIMLREMMSFYRARLDGVPADMPRLTEQYADIVIRAKPTGEILRLKDVADIELGSEFFDIYSNLNGHPSAAIVLKQSFGSNANDVIASVKEKLQELKGSFPPGMTYEISYDVSNFLDASVEKVVHTLIEAFILVALVVFVFLGDWRSTLIPTLAVPVSLVGTFIVLQLFGMTINLITLFALVLALPEPCYGVDDTALEGTHVWVEIRVDPQLTVGQAHDLGEAVERRLLAREGVCDAVVHVDAAAKTSVDPRGTTPAAAEAKER